MALAALGGRPLVHGQESIAAPPMLEEYKKEAAADVDRMYDFTQQMVDSVFSFGELGFQEFETERYVVTNGGDQPNVVPRLASVWYFFRETSYEGIRQMRETGDRIANGAAMMTDTKVSSRVLGSAWPSHMNRTLAEALHRNIASVGLPQWSEADQTLAKALQRELGVPETGLASELRELRGREEMPEEDKRGGGSDDIGDISWNLPTVSLNYPADIQAGPGHNWANVIAMATPIAHKE